MTRRWLTLAAVAALGVSCSSRTETTKRDKASSETASAAVTSNELLPPVRLEAAGKPIDTDIGHAAPFVGDFYGTGKMDLLVGQFGEGLLWIYRNEGAKQQPKYAAGVKFKEGAKGGRIPSG